MPYFYTTVRLGSTPHHLVHFSISTGAGTLHRQPNRGMSAPPQLTMLWIFQASFLKKQFVVTICGRFAGCPRLSDQTLVFSVHHRVSPQSIFNFWRWITKKERVELSWAWEWMMWGSPVAPGFKLSLYVVPSLPISNLPNKMAKNSIF